MNTAFNREREGELRVEIIWIGDEVILLRDSTARVGSKAEKGESRIKELERKLERLE